jgi:hypothetical protein
MHTVNNGMEVFASRRCLPILVRDNIGDNGAYDKVPDLAATTDGLDERGEPDETNGEHVGEEIFRRFHDVSGREAQAETLGWDAKRGRSRINNNKTHRQLLSRYH